MVQQEQVAPFRRSLDLQGDNNCQVFNTTSKGGQQDMLTQNSKVDLIQENLKFIDNCKVDLPMYDRQALGESWIHIGSGAFHRAHQAVYQNQLFNKSGASEWGICGISILKQDNMLGDILAKQDYLYTVLEKTPTQDRSTVVGSISNFILATDHYQKALQKLSDRNTKIVSFTVTESGYAIDQDKGDLDLKHPSIKHDLGNFEDCPQSIYGLLEVSLRIRKDKGLLPYTMMSCDNIFHNGDVLRQMLLKFLWHKDENLWSWVSQFGAFPNTMVDRITPTFAKDNIEVIAKNYGIKDMWPVACEPFKQWVVEDNFPLGRPKWEEVGVQMVQKTEVQKWEKLKLGILNIFHVTTGIYSKLCGHEYMHEGLYDILLVNFCRRIMDEEVTPLLDVVKGINLDNYKQITIQRVQNSAIKDKAQRLADDSSGKITKFLFPSLYEAVARQNPKGFKYMTFIVALWCKMLTCVDEYGNDFDFQDPQKERLTIFAKQGGKDPNLLLEKNKNIFGQILRESEAFKIMLKSYLEDIYTLGVQSALEKVLATS